MEGILVVSQQKNADIADTMHLTDVAMATIFCLSIYLLYNGANWRV